MLRQVLGRRRNFGTTQVLAAAALAAVSGIIAQPAKAVDGVWTTPGNGSWPVTTNWLNGVVADGADAVADFNTLDLTADATITLDSPRTVGKLRFGDTNPSNNWILNTGTSGTPATTLTLAGTGTGVTVNSGTATIGAIIAGTSGLIKDGAGQLTLGALNTYTGDTFVNAGILRLAAGGQTGAIRGALTVNAGATVQLAAANATGFDATNRVRTLNINGGLVDDVVNGDNLWAITINLTGGTMQSNGGTASATATQLFSLGGGSTVNSLASATTSVIAGRVNVRDGNPNDQLIFNVADGAADIDLLVSAALIQAGGTGAGTNHAIVKNGAGTMMINNTINVYTGGTIVNAGTLALSAGGGVGALKGTVTVNTGGTVRSDIKDSFGFNGGANSVAILNINGGTVTHAAVGTASSRTNLTIWNEVVNMTGGLLQATDAFGQLDFGNGSVLNVLASSNTATIGGTRLNFRQNNNLFTVAKGTAPVDLLISAAVTESDAPNRNLTKAGAGTLMMTGVNTYTGPTFVNAGTLAVSGTGSLASNAITIADGALFDVSGLTGGGTFTVNSQQTLAAGRSGTPANDIIGSLNVGGTFNVGGSGNVRTATISQDLTLSSGTLKYDLATLTTPGAGVNDLITARNLALTGTTSVIANALNASLGSGTYTLMKYTGTLTGDASNLVLAGTGSGQTRQSFAFDTTTTPGSVLLNVSGNSAILTWVGDASSNTWDLNQTPNWKNGATPDKYLDLDRVIFDDTGSNNPDVQLSQPFSPGSITINNSTKDYTFSGGGYISGLTGLVKKGTGLLTLGSNNDYTGATVINNGTLSVNFLTNAGNGSSIGSGTSLVLGDVTNGATLRYISGGTVTTDRAVTLNAGGGTIEMTDSSTILSLTGPVSGPGGLTTKGGGSVYLSGANTYTGPTIVGTGTLVRAASATALGSGTAAVTVQDGATLDVFGQNISGKFVTISGTGTTGQGALINSGAAQQNALNRVILAGDATVNALVRFDIRAGTTPTLDLAGHKLTKIGAGQFSLVATRVTAGDIDVNEGTLSIEAASSFVGPGTISINNATLGLFGNTAGSTTRNITLNNGTISNLNSNAILDSRITLADFTSNTITGPTNTIIANGGLAGNGNLTVGPAVTLNTRPGDLIGGNLTNNGGTISPGGTSVGNFTVGGGLNLNGPGTLVFDLSNTPAAGNDKIIVGTSGSLSMSGTGANATTIRLNLINSALGNGTYTLISGTTPGGGDVTNLALSVGATRQTLALDTTTIPGSVLLNVAGNTASLVWSGAVNTAWNVNTTQNWKNGANPDVFFNLDAVAFDDSSTNGAVALNQVVTPASMLFNNSTTNYVISGTGTISGSGALQKNGAGTLTFSSRQSYTGGTTVNAGTLALTIGGGVGALNGVLTVNPGATVRSDIKDSFGFNGGAASVTVLNINGGTVTHTSADNLTIWGETVNMTGGVIQATNAIGALDFGNGSVLNVLASSNTATIGGTRINFRQDNNLFTVAKGAAPVDLLISAVVTESDAPNRNLTKAGPGTLLMTAVNTYTGPTFVNGGTLSVSGSIAGSSGITVNNAGAVFQAASAQRVKALTVTAGQARVVQSGTNKLALTVGTGASATSQLALTGGKLDLTTNGLAVDYVANAVTDPDPLANDKAAVVSVRNQIIAGLGAGKDWLGTTGITSANAAADKSGKAIGYALASEVLPFANSATTDTFMGTTTVDKSTVVARYTLGGDATLDGTVDFNDLVKLAQNYNTTVSAGSESWWNRGDFTYDGITDFNDLVKLAQNYNTSLPSEPIPGATPGFEADLARAFASVPEPGTLSILGIGGIALLGRRRRRAR
jgi:autotransporter-associated beta strand protein